MEALIPIFLFMSVAAVLILRPLTKRLGLLLEHIARDRHVSRQDDTELARVRLQLEHVSQRLELMEERVDFTERLVASSRRPSRAESEAMPRERIDPLRFEDRQASYLTR